MNHQLDQLIEDLEAQYRVITGRVDNLQRSIGALTTEGLQGTAHKQLVDLHDELEQVNSIVHSVLADLRQARALDLQAGQRIAGN